MTAAPPGPPTRTGLPHVADFPIPPAPSQPAPHTGRMAIRFTAQGDTREECVQGLELLVAAGLVPTMLPVQVRTDGWMARAVPAPKPAVEEPAAG